MSNAEEQTYKFSVFDWLSKPVYLPLFQTAGCVERAVEAFVTCARVYNIEKDGENIRFKVFDDYKLKLKAYSKKRFDPFCRWDRVTFPYGDNKFIQTTIGQLNFFKWAIENKVIDYINNHYKEIDTDMNLRNSLGNKKRIDKNPEKSETIS